MSSPKRFDVYETVTEQVIDALERGVVPWRNPVLTSAMPQNFVSRKPYRGINILLLGVKAMTQGYARPYWLTFKQTQEKGGRVRRGEKSTMVVFFKPLRFENQETGEEENRFVCRYYRVFNLDQTEGIDPGSAATPEDSPDDLPGVRDTTPIEEATELVAGYLNDDLGRSPVVNVGGHRAAYRPSNDEVFVPEPKDCISVEEWHSCLFHELVHSTGHRDRLRREGILNPQTFGSAGYAREELIAEMGAAFLCAQSGISPQTIDNAAAYIGHWLKVLRSDPKLVIQAAGKAQRAVDHLTGVIFTAEPPQKSPASGEAASTEKLETSSTAETF